MCFEGIVFGGGELPLLAVLIQQTYSGTTHCILLTTLFLLGQILTSLKLSTKHVEPFLSPVAFLIKVINSRLRRDLVRLLLAVAIAVEH